MTSARLKISQEGLLWKTALQHLGHVGLHHIVVELWTKAEPRTRATVKYLESLHIGNDVLNKLSKYLSVR